MDGQVTAQAGSREQEEQKRRERERNMQGIIESDRRATLDLGTIDEADEEERLRTRKGELSEEDQAQLNEGWRITKWIRKRRKTRANTKRDEARLKEIEAQKRNRSITSDRAAEKRKTDYVKSQMTGWSGSFGNISEGLTSPESESDTAETRPDKERIKNVLEEIKKALDDIVTIWDESYWAKATPENPANNGGMAPKNPESDSQSESHREQWTVTHPEIQDTETPRRRAIIGQGRQPRTREREDTPTVSSDAHRRTTEPDSTEAVKERPTDRPPTTGAITTSRSETDQEVRATSGSEPETHVDSETPSKGKKTQTKTTPETTPKPAPKPAPEPAPKPAPKPAPEPETHVDSETPTEGKEEKITTSDVSEEPPAKEENPLVSDTV
nr:hypothetical protein [Lachnospiraceae bacterium]